MAVGSCVYRPLTVTQLFLTGTVSVGSSSAASLTSLHKLRNNLLDLLKRTHQNPWSKTENDGGL